LALKTNERRVVELNTPNRVSAKALLPTALVNKAKRRTVAGSAPRKLRFCLSMTLPSWRIVAIAAGGFGLEYLRKMTRAVLITGTVDKFMGDAI